MRVCEPRVRARLGALSLCLSLAVLLSGCAVFHRHRSLVGCREHEQPLIADAQSLPPLKTPSGLSAPDRSAQVTIPPLDVPERPRPQTAACLDQPPKYVSEPLQPPVRGPTPTPTPAPPAPAPAPAQ